MSNQIVEEEQFRKWSVLDRIINDPLSCLDLVESLLNVVRREHGPFLSASAVLPFYQCLDLIRNRIKEYAENPERSSELLSPVYYGCIVKFMFFTFVDYQQSISNMLKQDLMKFVPLKYDEKMITVFLKALNVKTLALTDSEFNVENIMSLLQEYSLQLSYWWKTKNYADMLANSERPNEVSERSTGCNMGIDTEVLKQQEEEVLALNQVSDLAEDLNAEITPELLMEKALGTEQKTVEEGGMGPSKLNIAGKKGKKSVLSLEEALSKIAAAQYRR